MIKIFACLIALTTTAGGFAAVTVATSGADFDSLATAVSTVNPGEEIRVRSDFAEDEPVAVTKNLTIISYNTGFTAPEAGARLDAYLTVDASGGPVTVSASGLHFSDLLNTSDASILTTGGVVNLTLQDGCIITPTMDGVVIDETAADSLINLGDTTVSGGRNGVAIETTSTVTANGASIDATTLDGIVIQPVASATLSLTNTIVSDTGANGIFILGSTDLTLTSCTVSNNIGCGVLMAKEMETGSMALLDSDFLNNSQTGFAVLAPLTPASMSNCNFNRNRVGFATNWDTTVRNVSGAGGINLGTVSNCEFNQNNLIGLFLGRHLTVNFDTCQFNENEYHGLSQQDPRAALADISTININNCVFDRNSQIGTGFNGQGIAYLAPVNMTLTSTSLSSNLRSSGLLLDRGPASTLSLTDCLLNDNFGRSIEIYRSASTNLTVNNCELNGNQSHSIWVRESAKTAVTTVDTSINQSKLVGVQIELSAESTLNMTNCDVIKNKEYGVRVDRSNITVMTANDCQFSSNTLTGVQFSRSPFSRPTLINCDMNNNLNHGFYSFGGAFASTTMTDCQMNNNFYDGLVILGPNGNDGNLENINNCQFSNNGRHGVHLINKLFVNLTNCQMKGNAQAGVSRGLNPTDASDNAANPDDVTLTGCDLTGNNRSISIQSAATDWKINNCLLSSGVAGSAIVVANNFDDRNAQIQLKQSTLSSDDPSSNALVIATRANLLFENCVLDGAESGFVASNSSSLSFDYSTIATRAEATTTGLSIRDTAATGRALTINRSIVTGVTEAISAENAAPVNITNSLVNGTVSGATLGAGTISGAPKFVDAANGNYSLLGSSPAVAKVAFIPGDIDYLGVTRPQPVTASLADMGAYEVNEASSVSDWVIY